MSSNVVDDNNPAGPATGGSEQAQAVRASQEGNPEWTPAYPGQLYEVPIYVDSSDEEEQETASARKAAREPSVLPVKSHKPVSNKTLSKSHHSSSITHSVQPTSLPLPSVITLSKSGSFTLSMGKSSARVVKSDDGMLYVSMVDCLASAGFIDPGSIIRRLSKRFGPFSSHKMRFNKSNNTLHMFTMQECVRMLILYMGVCRTNKEDCITVIGKLNAYIK